MLFGLTNVPASFQEMMDTIFNDMEACILYLNNILIYGDNMEAEHQAIVENVQQQYVEHGLVVNHLKSQLNVQETIFLLHVINGREVKMNGSKLKNMSKWPITIKKKKFQVLLGFANY